MLFLFHSILHPQRTEAGTLRFAFYANGSSRPGEGPIFIQLWISVPIVGYTARLSPGRCIVAQRPGGEPAPLAACSQEAGERICVMAQVGQRQDAAGGEFPVPPLEARLGWVQNAVLDVVGGGAARGETRELQGTRRTASDRLALIRRFMPRCNLWGAVRACPGVSIRESAQSMSSFPLLSAAPNQTAYPYPVILLSGTPPPTAGDPGGPG